MRVKICGITNRHDAESAASLGADAIGFVFAKSPRRITIKEAFGISKALGPWIATVGVFVNEKWETVQRIADQCRLSAVQLHGDESPAYAKRLSKHLKIIKAFRISNRVDLNAVKGYDTDAFLFDSRVPNQHGGSGVPFEWALVKSMRITRPFIVSGGLNPENVKKVVRELGPYGVDVASGVEISPGKKSTERMREFIKNAKEVTI